MGNAHLFFRSPCEIKKAFSILFDYIMNIIVDNLFVFRMQWQLFINSLVISISLILAITITIIIIENLLYKIENNLIFSSDTINSLSVIIIFYIFEFVIINSIFLFLGSFLFSTIENSYYTFYKIMFIANLIFSLVKTSIKLFSLFKKQL